jgi:hypothetical protein
MRSKEYKTIPVQLEVKMERFTKDSVTKAVICIVLLLVFSCGTAFSLGEELEKKYAPIVGMYEFSMEAQVMNVKFWVEDGKFWGAPPDETPAEIVPLEGEEWKFEATADDGQYYIIEFAKDESGKFNKCTLETMGMVIEGTKIEE